MVRVFFFFYARARVIMYATMRKIDPRETDFKKIIFLYGKHGYSISFVVVCNTLISFVASPTHIKKITDSLKNEPRPPN